MSAWDRRTYVKLTRHLKRSVILPALKVGVEVMRGHRSVHLVGTAVADAGWTGSDRLKQDD